MKLISYVDLLSSYIVNSLSKSYVLGVDSFEFCSFTFISSENNDSFISIFACPLLFVSCFMRLAKNSSTLLTEDMISEEKLSKFYLEHFIISRHFPSILKFL